MPRPRKQKEEPARAAPVKLKTDEPLPLLVNTKVAAQVTGLSKKALLKFAKEADFPKPIRLDPAPQTPMFWPIRELQAVLLSRCGVTSQVQPQK
jgi:predicted DNA-binding transcriptional regulator AlpA